MASAKRTRVPTSFSVRTLSALRPKTAKRFRGFTLVELIVVITILTILATVGFLALSGYTSDAGRSATVSNLRLMEKGLSTNATVTGKLPIPTDAVDVTYSGGIVWKQWTAGKSVMAAIGMGEPPKDPAGNAEFDYSVTANGMEYQVGSAYLDAAASHPLEAPRALASTKIPKAVVSGTYNGVFVPVSVNGRNYLIAAPSIILSNLSPSLRELKSMSPSFVADGKPGVPASWSGKVAGLSATGIAFGGAGYSSGKLFESSTQAFPKTSAEIAGLAASVASAYSGSSAASLPKIAGILSWSPQAASASLAAAGSNALGRELAPTTISASSSAGCQSVSHSGYSLPVAGAGESIFASKPVTNGTGTLSASCSNGRYVYGSESFSCAPNYVPMNSSCVHDVCDGTIPTGGTQNGTQSAYGSWSHSVTTGSCKFMCIQGYWWNESSCVQASAGNYVASAGSILQTPADAGHYCPGNGNVSQTQCPADSYCPAGSSSPAACPVGTSSPAGSDAASDCVDTQPPSGGSFTMPTSTMVQAITLSVVCPTDNVSSGSAIQVAYGNSASPTNWTACVSSVSHTLTEWSGMKTVYVRFRDAAGNASADSTFEIASSVDTVAPTGGDFTITETTYFFTNPLSITCPTDDISAAEQIQMAYGNAENPTNWTACVSSVSHTLTSGDGTKTVYVRFRDAAGNASADISKTTTLTYRSPAPGTFTATTGGRCCNNWDFTPGTWYKLWGIDTPQKCIEWVRVNEPWNNQISWLPSHGQCIRCSGTIGFANFSCSTGYSNYKKQ